MHRNPLSIKTAREQTSLIEIIHVIQLSNNSKLLCSALLQQQKENQRQDYFYLTRDGALAKIWIIIYIFSSYNLHILQKHTNILHKYFSNFK